MIGHVLQLKIFPPSYQQRAWLQDLYPDLLPCGTAAQVRGLCEDGNGELGSNSGVPLQGA